MKNLEDFGVSACQPLYVYQQPMFMLTVSVVLLEDNGIIILEGEQETIFDPIDEGRHPDIIIPCRFPGGLVKSGKETIQFSAIRQIKEQTGVALKKDALIP